MIKPGIEFKIKNEICYSNTEIYTSDDTNKKSIIVVDLLSNTNYPNINATPVLQIFYDTLQDKYILKNNFIILGECEDVCSI